MTEKSLQDYILDDMADAYNKTFLESQKKYYDELLKMKNKPRIVQGVSKDHWYIMKRNEIVANNLTQQEAEALIKLID